MLGGFEIAKAFATLVASAVIVGLAFAVFGIIAVELLFQAGLL